MFSGCGHEFSPAAKKPAKKSARKPPRSLAMLRIGENRRSAPQHARRAWNAKPERRTASQRRDVSPTVKPAEQESAADEPSAALEVPVSRHRRRDVPLRGAPPDADESVRPCSVRCFVGERAQSGFPAELHGILPRGEHDVRQHTAPRRARQPDRRATDAARFAPERQSPPSLQPANRISRIQAMRRTIDPRSGKRPSTRRGSPHEDAQGRAAFARKRWRAMGGRIPRWRSDKRFAARPANAPLVSPPYSASVNVIVSSSPSKCASTLAPIFSQRFATMDRPRPAPSPFRATSAL